MSTDSNRPWQSEHRPLDPNWRESTYLDSLEDLPVRDYEFKLRQVLGQRMFAPQQPPEFGEFAGCRARFDLNVLDLGEAREKALLVAVAGSGARVPGTQFVLRVAEIGWAYFEERPGDFPALPHDWMEVLHLIKDNWEERYEWIGHRHDEVQYVVRWERYEETASGWRLKPRCALKLTQAQWRAEIDRVSAQLTEFIDELLPAISRHDPSVFDIPTEPSARYFAQRLRCLDDWLDAARRLRDVVDSNSQRTSTPQRVDLEYFRRFTHGAPSIDYAVDNGRIHWAISCFSEVDWLAAAYHTFRLHYGWPPKDESHPGHTIEATKRFLLAGSTDDVRYYNEYIAMLAALADDEPEFVKGMLDAEAWGRRIESNSAISDETRARQLHKLTAPVPRGYFRMVMHNALLHVIGALANNRFEEIRGCIEHPEFVGRYSPLVPHYLFANLLAKAHVFEKYRVLPRSEIRTECA